VRRIAAISSCLGDVLQAMCFGKQLLLAVLAARVLAPLAAVDGREVASALPRR
jgi:hypothetical protein